MVEFLLPCLWAFLACVGFCLIFNIRGRTILWASAGGALAWAVYLIFAFCRDAVLQSFLAILAASLYAEVVARIRKAPATVYLVVGLLPLVPGGGIYQAMEYCIAGDTMAFLTAALQTLAIAGALALGVLLVSSLVRLWYSIRRSRHG